MTKPQFPALEMLYNEYQSAKYVERLLKEVYFQFHKDKDIHSRTWSSIRNLAEVYKWYDDSDD